MPSPPVEMHQVRLPVPVPSHGVGEFSVGLGLSLHQAVVNVRGEVDALTGPTLHAVLEAAVEQVECEVVLELSELTFMDAAGLSAIASTIATLGATGRKLSIRSAPAITLRILDVCGLSGLVEVDEPDPEAAPLGAEQFANDRSRAVQSRPVDLRSDLARARSVPASGELVDAALRLVASLASATVEGADGASVTLERDGRLATVAASNETVSRMDCHQYDTGEGPCLAAAAEGHWFHIESLHDETRWPTFVPLALDEGIASILSTPLLVADRSVGALNIYSSTARAFGAEQQKLAALFATGASGILADVGTDIADDQPTGRSDVALHERELIAHAEGVLIAHAEGVLMAREHISAEDAAATLHRSSRAAMSPVLQLAAEVVASARAGMGPEPMGSSCG